MRSIRADELMHCNIPKSGTPTAVHADSTAITIAGVTMELRTNVPGLVDAFRSRYCDHPPLSTPDFVYYVTSDAGGYTMWCEHDGALRWPHGALPLSAVLFLADAAAIAALIHFDPRLVSMHAAGIEFGGIAAAIAADSHGGKTTTALACARAGMRVYSDERVLLRESLVLPFLRRCSVRAGAAQLLHAGDGSTFANALADSAGVSWMQTFGAQCAAPPAPLAAVFLIAGKGEVNIVPVDAARLMPDILRWFDCRAGGMQRVSRAVALLRSAHCYMLTLGAPDETARAIAGLLSRLAAA